MHRVVVARIIVHHCRNQKMMMLAESFGIAEIDELLEGH